MPKKVLNSKSAIIFITIWQWNRQDIHSCFHTKHYCYTNIIQSFLWPKYLGDTVGGLQSPTLLCQSFGDSPSHFCRYAFAYDYNWLPGVDDSQSVTHLHSTLLEKVMMKKVLWLQEEQKGKKAHERNSQEKFILLTTVKKLFFFSTFSATMTS